jgi:hypothetical protein
MVKKVVRVQYTVYEIFNSKIIKFPLSRIELFLHFVTANQIEKNEMGGACGTYGGGERCIPDFDGETRGKATTWETQAQMGG